jgi:hypothetical protein
MSKERYKACTRIKLEVKLCAVDERLCLGCYEHNERQLRLTADGSQNTNIITNGAMTAVAISATTLSSDMSTDA